MSSRNEKVAKKQNKMETQEQKPVEEQVKIAIVTGANSGSFVKSHLNY